MGEARAEWSAGHPTPTDETMPQTNILIVEDDLTTQELARMILESAGYAVSTARSAEDAERILRNLWPDVVLMDRDLPGMDGLEFTRRLKHAEETSGITILAFSSSLSRADNELALAAGSDGFIHKPFSVRGLIQTVAWHVAARQGEAARASRLADTTSISLTPSSDTARHVSLFAKHLDAPKNSLGELAKLSSSAIVSGLLLLASAASAW